MANPIAYCLVRDRPHYRREVFKQGLERLGYTVKPRVDRRIDPHDILIIWNRYGNGAVQAKAFERTGCPVIVTENGYLDMKDTSKAFALALDHHNGAGRWPQDLDRLDRLAVELEPWRDGSNGILVLPQRGIGPPGVAMPHRWQTDVMQRLRKIGVDRLARVRPHPGGNKRVKPLAEDLDGIGLAVTWGSGAGLKALCAGVPVMHEFKQWIGAPAAHFGVEAVHPPLTYDREVMLRRLSGAQWSGEEIATGEPFKMLLEMHNAVA